MAINLTSTPGKKKNGCKTEKKKTTTTTFKSHGIKNVLSIFLGFHSITITQKPSVPVHDFNQDYASVFGDPESVQLCIV